MRHSTNRRHFLGRSLGLSSGLAIGAGLPGPWLQALAREPVSNDRILIVVQLSGGNDGLNTVVPYNHDDYRKARPKLGIAAEDVLRIDSENGLHPSLSGLSRLLEAGRFSIVQGVGYEAPNRSHFESMDIWHTCHRKEQRTGEGWLGRWAASTDNSTHGDSLGLHLGHEQQPLALAARGVQLPSIAAMEQFRLKVIDDGSLVEPTMSTMAEAVSASADAAEGLLGFLQTSTESALAASDRINKALSQSDTSHEFPESQLGEKLQVISRLILAGLSTKVYYVTLDGFDTHALQPQAHAGLLRQWSEAVEALVNRLERAGQAERVLVMTFSEFGRRVQENASQGTDHGAAAPVFFAGPSLAQSIVGELPSLTDLDDGDLKFHTDFRRVYATLLEGWFGASSREILGGQFETLPVLG